MSVHEDQLIFQLENCTLPKECFHHADHVRMAFLYLRRYPPIKALQCLSTSLARFAAANGKPERYHETITWTFFFLIRERMARMHPVQTWAEFASHNPDLLDWPNNILKKYYRDETLSSDFARSTFVFPDRTLARP